MARLIAALVLAAGPAVAQDWQFGSFDNGAWFEAHAFVSDASLSVMCGGVSPGGLPLPQSDEPMITDVGTVMLTLSEAVTGLPGAMDPPPRDDVALVADGLGYALPGLEYDLMNASGWMRPLSLSEPLIGKIMSAQRLAVLRPDGAQIELPRANAGTVMAQMIEFCQERWATPAAAPSMAAAAEAAILAGCNGPATRMEGYLLEGEIDGDGRPDVVLDWSEVSCSGDMPRPFCGASLCSADVYLSGSFDRTGPAQLLAQGVALVDLSNGNKAVEVGASLSGCVGDVCTFYWYWTGQSFEELQ